MSGNEPSDAVPYDENAWERIVAELGDGMPQLPLTSHPRPKNRRSVSSRPNPHLCRRST